MSCSQLQMEIDYSMDLSFHLVNAVHSRVDSPLRKNFLQLLLRLLKLFLMCAPPAARVPFARTLVPVQNVNKTKGTCETGWLTRRFRPVWKPTLYSGGAVAQSGGHRRLWKCLARRRFQLEYVRTVRRSFENPGDADNRFQPQRVGQFELGQHASSLELNIEENGSRKPSAPLSSDCVGQQGIQSDTQTQSQFTFTQSHIDVHWHTIHTKNNTHPRAQTHTHALAYIRLT